MPLVYSTQSLSSLCVTASLMAQMVKNLPAMQEIHVQSLGLEDPLKKGRATHFSILASRIPWTEKEAWQATVPWVRQESDTAVIRRWQALSGIIGRKARAGGFLSLM